MSEQERVWKRVEEEVPKFAVATPLKDNFEAVQEIVLGGSPVWRTVNARFVPSSDSRVMDIGANRGVYSMYCGVHGARVRAYEPFPLLHEKLVDLIEYTGMKNIEPVRAAVSGFTGQARYLGHATPVEDHMRYNGGLQTCGVNWTPADMDRSVVADCISLDDAVGNEEWDCVKVDVEGGEVEIFLNASEETFSKITFCFVEFHPWIPEPDYRALIDRLEHAFRFEGTYRNELGRWDAAYLLRRPR